MVCLSSHVESMLFANRGDFVSYVEEANKDSFDVYLSDVFNIGNLPNKVKNYYIRKTKPHKSENCSISCVVEDGSHSLHVVTHNNNLQGIFDELNVYLTSLYTILEEAKNK